MKKWTKKMRRITAFILTVILLGTSVNLPVMAEEDSQLALLEEKARRGFDEEDMSMVLPDAVSDDILGDVSDDEEENPISIMSEATEGLVFTEADNQSELIAAVDSGENVRLTANITLTESIEIHTSLTVDLNGQTVTGAENASVFEVSGSGVEVVFTDSSVDEAGMVTAVGTVDISAAVRVENEASVSIEKGTYAGGYAPLQVEETGSVIVNGGTLDGVGAYYAAANWGGNLTIPDGVFQSDGSYIIYMYSGTMTLMGGSFVTTTPGLGSYVMEYRSGTLNLSNFTESGYRFYFGNAPEENQVSIPEGYAWFDYNNTPVNKINADDQLTLAKVLTVSFAANGGSGTMASESAMAGTYWLPECEFTAPEGLSFLGWATASDGKAITDYYYSITEDITFYAIWGKVYDVYVGGVGMEDGDYLPSNGTEVSAVQPTTGGYAYYKDGNLTLNHYVYSGVGYWYYVGSAWEYSSVVYSTKNLTITLEGENKLANTAYDSAGIVVEGDLTISGTGTLELEADYYGIACYSGEEADGNVVINDGLLSIEEADGSIYTEGSLTMNGGTLDIETNRGIEVDGNVVINGGLLNIESVDSGIYTAGTVVIYNGYVDITAGNNGSVHATGGILFEEEVVELLCPSGGSVLYDAGGYYYIVDANNDMAGRVVIGPLVEHIWSTDYVYNYEAHWHICTDEDCFLTEDNTLYAFVEGSGYGVHDTNGANGTCSVCGYNASKEVAIYVGNVGLAVGEYLDNSGRINTVQPSTGGYAYYTDGVLTLKDYAYTGTGYVYEENEIIDSAAIYCGRQELKLVLQGENQLTNTFTDGDGIYCAGGLAIEGDSITLTAEDDGIYLDGNLDVNSGTITIITKDDDGIDVDGDATVTINDGTLTIEANDDGIDIEGDFIVNGGKVNITSATNDCVDVLGMITIRGGVIILDADSEGLNSSEDILIEGGMITMNTVDCGILAYEDLTINGGVLIITSNLDTVEEVDPAIKVSGNLTIGEQVEIQIPEGGVVATLEEHAEATAYYNIIADAEGQTATYVVMKENPITAQDKEITYDGSKVDVSELFTAVEGAGEVVYTIAEGGSGVGTLEGSMLTITKVGTILIQAEVAANPIFVPGSEKAVATLTVNKGEGVASVSIAGWRYNQTASVPVAASETNGVENVTYFYKEAGASEDAYVTEVPVMVGEYTLKAVFAENDLYKETIATADFLLDIPFEDVDRESWQYKGIFHVFRIGLMKGVSDTKFKPNDNFTREQMAMVLYSHAGKPVVEFSEKFTDVKDGNWYSDAVTWAAMQGITAGYPDGSFGVGKSITREEFVVMLYKYAKQIGMVTEVPSGELSSFVDGDSVSSWAKEAMLWATQKGMLTGKPASTGGYYIDPQGTATRAESATILMKFTMQ